VHIRIQAVNGLHFTGLHLVPAMRNVIQSLRQQAPLPLRANPLKVLSHQILGTNFCPAEDRE